MPLSIGQRLKQAREERNLSLQKVEQVIRIRVKILEALEADDYSSISSAAQARGFLRNYCEYLEVDLNSALREFQNNQPANGEISGPFPQAAGDVPAQIILTADEAPPPSLAEGLLADQLSESTLMGDPATSAADASTEKPKRGRKKKEIAEGAETALKPTRTRKKKEIIVEEVIPVYSEFAPIMAVEEPQSLQFEAEEILPVITEHQDSVESLPVEQEQPSAQEEAKPNLLEKLKTLVKIKIPKQESVEDVVDQKEEIVVVQITSVDKSPQEIFAEIGNQLQQRREMLSLSLDEVELHTHVRAVFLRALEEGDFDKLPSTVQLRGMLSNYATFLDLDADTLLLRFADALQLQHRLKYPDKPAGSKPPMPVAANLPPLRSFMVGDLVFGSLIVAILFGLGIWGIGRVIASQEETAVIPTAFFIADVLSTGQATQALDVTATPVVDVTLAVTGTPASVEIPLQPANLQMVILATERTFMRVSVDGDVKFDGRAVLGTTYTFDAQRTIEVLTGNGAALRLTFNGRDLGLLGGFGEVVSRIYTLGGVVTATATLSPTPTNTPVPTLTPEFINETATPTLPPG